MENQDHMPAAVSDEAIEYGMRKAIRMLEHRRGHGQAAPGSRVLSRDQLAAVIAYAYEEGKRSQS